MIQLCSALAIRMGISVFPCPKKRSYGPNKKNVCPLNRRFSELDRTTFTTFQNCKENTFFSVRDKQLKSHYPLLFSRGNKLTFCISFIYSTVCSFYCSRSKPMLQAIYHNNVFIFIPFLTVSFFFSLSEQLAYPYARNL